MPVKQIMGLVMKIDRNLCLVIPAVITIAVTGCDSSGTGANGAPIALNGPKAIAAGNSTSADGTSVTFSELLSGFPERAKVDFMSRFPGIETEERFRRLNYVAGAIANETYGLEGESSGSEFEVTYSAEGNFLSSKTSTEISTLPSAIKLSVATTYPGALFDNVEQITDDAGIISYQFEITDGVVETELTVDTSGIILTTVEEIPASSVPASVISGVESELQGFSEVEYEKITASDGVVQYLVDLETKVESVEYALTIGGEITSIKYEEELDSSENDANEIAD